MIGPKGFSFRVEATSGEARAGTLTTATTGAVVKTPVFMPVGTQGTLKAIDHALLPSLGIRLILANTYHLYLRPGPETLGEAGGLHRFMNLDAALLTDSGGFQVFSLGKLMKIRDEGISFASHLDGSRHEFTPEKVVAINRAIRPDIMMVLDECSPYPCDRPRAERALSRTTRWAERARAAWESLPEEERPFAPFAIVQGAFFADLRKRSAEEICALDFPGYGIGGLSVGEPKELMREMLEAQVPHMPRDRPRYLMGVGSIPEMLDAVERGVDMFDCVLPTRLGRHAALLTPDGGRIHLKNARHAKAFHPPVEGCDCPLCGRHTLAYLHHLTRAGESLGATLASLHNIVTLTRVMRAARAAILEGRFAAHRDSLLAADAESGRERNGS